MVHEYAAALKAPKPMMSEALSLHRMLVHLGHAELDTAALVKLYDPSNRQHHLDAPGICTAARCCKAAVPRCDPTPPGANRALALPRNFGCEFRNG